MSKSPYLYYCFLLSLMIGMCWMFLAPSPVPFDIEIQRELGFVGHILAFSIFSLACFGAFPKRPRQIAGVLFTVAIFLEASQILIPSRGADFMDLIMNGAGIIIGYFIFRILMGAKLALTSRLAATPNTASDET